MSSKVTVDISPIANTITVAPVTTSVEIVNNTTSVEIENIITENNITQSITNVDISPTTTTVEAILNTTTVDISPNTTTVGVGDASIVASNLASTIHTSHDESSWITGYNVQSSFDNLATTADSRYVNVTGDTMTGDLHFGDDDKALFGPGNELKIYHSVNNQSYIHEVGSGDLNILATNLKIHDADENRKVLVNSEGIDVTGTITFDGGTTSANLNFGDGIKAVFGNESDLQMYHRGDHSFITDVGEGNLYIDAREFYVRNDAGVLFQSTSAGSSHMLYADNTKLVTTSDGIDVTGEATATVQMEAPLFKGDLEGAVHFKATDSGTTLAKGDVVYITGYLGQRTTVDKADASDSAKMPAFGIVNSVTGSNVDVLTFGSLVSLSTTGIATGTELYVSATTPGGYETSAPTGEGNLIQKIAKVVRGDSNSGSIKIMGAGRTNATPNLNDGNIFIGNSSNIPTTASFDTTFGTSFATRSTSDLSEGDNEYFTSARADARIAAASIGDLSNVDITTTAPTNNQVLVWSTDKFVPADQSGAGGVDLTAFSVGDDATASDSGGIEYDNTSGIFTYTPPDLSSYLTTVAFADLTAKPTTITGYGITDALEIGTSATTAMAGNTALSAIGGTLDLSSQVTGTLPVGNMAATALTTIQTATSEGDMLGKTAQEGDVIVRTDQNKTYMHNGGTASPNAMSNFTLLATPTDAVTSVDGNTGAVTTLQIGTTAGTALEGNTTYVAAESDPIVGAVNGIVKADGEGNISAATGGTSGTIDYSTLKIGTTAGTALEGNTTSFGGSASPINLGTHSGTGTQTINIGGAAIGGAGTNIKNIYIGNGAHNGGATNVYIGPSSETTTAQTTIYHPVDFEYGAVSFNGANFTVDPAGTSNTITLGKTTGTGTITIGRSTGSQTIDIAGASDDGSKTSTVNIARGGGTRTVNIASDSHSGSTTVVNVGNPSGTANSTILLRGNLSIDRPMYGNGATEYYDFFDHLGGMTTTGSDGDWDISGTGLNALTEITIPASSHHGTVGKRGSLRMSCQSKFYNSSSTTKRNAEYYLGLQMKSKGASSQSENLGAATLVSSPAQFEALWSFAGNVTDKIVAGFGALANSNSASGMQFGGAPILGVIYDDSVNKTYIRVTSMYYYNNLGGSSLSNGQTTSFDVYYNPTEFKSSGTWVSSLRADTYNSRVKITVQPQSHNQMHHSFNLSIPKQYSKTELRLIFDYTASNTNLTASVQAIEGTVMLEGSKV